MPGTPVSTQSFARSYWIAFQISNTSGSGNSQSYAMEFLLDEQVNSADDYEKLGKAIHALNWVTQKWGYRNVQVDVFSIQPLLTQGSQVTLLKFK